jgi:hypothetical protein
MISAGLCLDSGFEISFEEIYTDANAMSWPCSSLHRFRAEYRSDLERYEFRKKHRRNHCQLGGAGGSAAVVESGFMRIVSAPALLT